MGNMEDMAPQGALTDPGFPAAARATAGSKPLRLLHVRLGRVRIQDDQLVIAYEVRPVPDDLRHDGRIVHTDRAGVVLGGTGTVATVRTGYRRARSGSRVIGALRAGPACWKDLGTITVLFSPFTHDARLRHSLCEIELQLTGTQASIIASRGDTW